MFKLKLLIVDETFLVLMLSKFTVSPILSTYTPSLSYLYLDIRTSLKPIERLLLSLKACLLFVCVGGERLIWALHL